MPDPIPVSASDLRQAMRDPRYWQSGHPERGDYTTWVEGAFRQLHEGPANSDGLVWVHPYTRTRDGETEEVSGHFRQSSRQGGQGDTGGDARIGTVSVEREPRRGIEVRYTARDWSGRLIGSCDNLSDGSQLCTLAMPDGSVVVQGLHPGDGEFTPVSALASAYSLPPLLGAATRLYLHFRNRSLVAPPDRAAPDTPFMLFYRGFEGTEAGVQVTVGTLSDQRVNEFCPKTAEFEEGLEGIAAGIPREGLTPQQWGTAVHSTMHDQVRRQYGRTSNIVRSEFSLVRGENQPYGTPGSTRLDIFHRVEGTSTICVYDIKTGQAILNSSQATRIYLEAYDFALRTRVPNPRVLIIELHRAP